ncbi:hypothetical protein [Paenibacillus sp. 1P07SE]|uniref:hypothetical protein n=1 Tax=Paenibacillus sp. 1P07SE TaxID=3132209 RepID=UPI0039A4875C
MRRSRQSRTLIVMMVLALSLVWSGLVNAAPMTMKKDGMELVHLRQAADMYGYSIEWNSTEKSVTLMYMGTMMKDNMMMDDDMMMADDMMMQDDMMMDSGMKPMAEMIKLTIGSKMITVDGKTYNLDLAPAIYDGSTYVTEMLIMQYLKPAPAMMK